MILASASASRARLLQAAGVAFSVHAAGIDEDPLKTSAMDPRAIAEALAELKALRVSASHPCRLVLGADQVLICDGQVMSKAATPAAAADQLRLLRGKRHELVSAVVLVRDGTPVWRHVDGASLRMRDFSDAFLEAYLRAEEGEILGSVGCYRLEGMGVQLFAAVEGDYFSILGLPLLPLLAALRELGVVGT